MEICKNKKSNLYFINIGRTGRNEVLLVTPEAKVISLKLELFDDVEDFDEAYLLRNRIITDAQLDRYHEYNKDRSEETGDLLMHYFEQLPLNEMEIFIQKLKEIASKK